MAELYPIFPASVVDDLNDLNASLLAYHMAVEGLLRRFATDGAPYAFETVIAGLNNLFDPVLQGYQDIELMCDRFRKMGVVGTCVLSDSN